MVFRGQLALYIDASQLRILLYLLKFEVCLASYVWTFFLIHKLKELNQL